MASINLSTCYIDFTSSIYSLVVDVGLMIEFEQEDANNVRSHSMLAFKTAQDPANIYRRPTTRGMENS